MLVYKSSIIYTLLPVYSATVEPLYYEHPVDRNKCPYYRGVRFREVDFIWISVTQGPSELSIVERCP